MPNSDAYLISESDSGQADAINKGFRLLEAEVLCWLNSDDLFLPGALAKVCDWFNLHPSADVGYGIAIILDEIHNSARLAVPAVFDRERLCYDDYIIQPSTFWRSRVWESVGPLTESLHFVLDWDWWLRASEHFQFDRIETCLSIYRIHEQHKTSSRRCERLKEVLSLVDRYAPARYAQCMHDVAPIANELSEIKRRLYRWHLMPLRRLFYPRLYLKYSSRLIERVIPAVL